MSDHDWTGYIPVGAELPPSPIENTVPLGSGWGDDYQPPRQRWVFDAHPNQSRWNATAYGHGAGVMMSAACTNHHLTGEPAPLLDTRWHRPDEDNIAPLGRGPRGDMAPEDVHDTLDVVLSRRRSLTDLEVRLLHAWIDRAWLLHSRAPQRAMPAMRQLGFFDDGELDILAAALRASPLTDFRVLMLAVDPRETPVYGRTRDGPGVARLFRRFNSTFDENEGLSRETDHMLWDEDDGGESGSSAEGQEKVTPFLLTPLQRQAQRIRHAIRRIRRVTGIADKAEKLADEQEKRIISEVERSKLGAVLLKVLLRGLRSGPVPDDPVAQSSS